MLLVFPVTSHDFKLAEKLLAFMETLGNGKEGKGHSVLIVLDRPLIGIEARFVVPFRRMLFDDIQVLELLVEDNRGWPYGPNLMFREVVEYLHGKNNKLPWYLFEPDCTPIKAGWLDSIQTEYNQAAKPFMGCVTPTRFVDVITKEVVGTDGEHMVGTGVYPANFLKYSVLWRFLNRDPWDAYLRWELRPHVHPTKLIAHNWKTKNYDFSPDGRIICDPIGNLGMNDPIPKEAVVVHGCKDGSLMNILKKYR